MSSITAFAQSNKVKKAYEEYAAGYYSTAADMLRNAYQSTKVDKEQQAEILFMIGMCYRNINEPSRAEMWYQKAIGKGYTKPLIYLYLADAKKMVQKYAEAKEMYSKYKEQVPQDKRGENGVKSCEMAIQSMENGNGYVVENMKFFNSRQSDFSPAYAAEDYLTVYFTSSRDAAKGEIATSVTGEKFSDIFKSTQDRKGVWSQPVPIQGEINTEADEGMCSFSTDFQTMYFTRCKVNPSKNMGCQIFSAKLTDGVWGKEKLIDIAKDSVIIAHPAISPDNLTLYFVSDMEGTLGGKDIWKVSRKSENDEWGLPENLGSEINTEGNEMFPYVHPDGTLYFSSDGHIGLGGLDIFKAKNEGQKWTIENMGYPINSPGDDFGITFEAENERGFFSSSRTSRGDDDIFTFTLPPLAFTLTGLVKDEKTGAPLSEALVKIISSDGLTNEMMTATDGTFSLTLKANTDYVFQANKENYLNGKERETTKGLDRSKDFRITILLTSVERPIELPNIFYDYGKADLRPESFVSLDALIATLNDNPKITIEIGAHTDSRGSDKANEDLSQRRAQSVVNYLLEKGIASGRLSAKGYGESAPKVVDEQMLKDYPFLRLGVTLTESYINSLPNKDDQEIAHQLNRRTNFRVLSTNYE